MIPKILSALLILYLASSSWAQSLDLVIRNGSVLDGSGSPAKQVDIGIRGDRVVVIGKSLRQKASRVIDARGLMVAPGFIDPHTHTFEDLSNPAISRNDAYLMQGVTTVVTAMTGAALFKLVRRCTSGRSKASAPTLPCLLARAPCGPPSWACRMQSPHLRK
jgi:N-acyl-D-amino-acid deacylase